MQPTLVDSSFREFPAVVFDGIDDYLLYAEPVNFRFFFGIINYNNDIFGAWPALFGSTDAPYLLYGNVNDIRLFTQNLTGDTLKINSVYKSDFSPLEEYKIVSVVSNPKPIPDVFLGSRTGTYSYWKGGMVELIFGSTELTASEQNLVYNYLCDKYSPPVNLGDDVYLNSFCPFTISVGNKYKTVLWSTGSTDSIITVSETGCYSVQVVDCFGRQSADTICVFFPIFNFIDTTICFNDTLSLNAPIQNMNYLWSNGMTDATIKIYEAGNYWLKMSDSSGCYFIDTFKVEIDSFLVLATLGPDKSVCSGDSLSLFKGAEVATSYQWSTGDTSSVIVIQNPGEYSLTVTNYRGCVAMDTINIVFHGYKPFADFIADSVCLGTITNFIDNSSAIPPDEVVFWKWIIEGDTIIEQSPQYLFPQSGNYLVQLYVSTASGCYQWHTDTVVVYPLPQIDFAVSGFCEGQLTSFTSYNTIATGQVVDYLWQFGDGSFAIDENPAHVFQQYGLYTVSYTAYSDKNCQNTISKEVEIKFTPRAGFISGASCAGAFSYFTDTSVTLSYYPVIQWKWDFGDGNTSLQQHPAHVYQNAGNYTAKLIVRILNGCTDTIEKVIEVSTRPTAGFEHDSVCVGQLLHIRDTSKISNGFVQSWKWFVGSDYYSNQPEISLTPQHEGSLPVTLVVESNTLCSDTSVKMLQVRPKPTVHFIAEPSYGAYPLTVNFENLSEFGQSLWNFSDGSISTVFAPQHTFEDTGKYVVWLTLTNVHGCKDSVSRIILVVPNLLDLAVTDIQIVQQAEYLIASANVHNRGTLPLENPEMQLWVNGRFLISEILYDTLFSGEQTWYMFNGRINTQWLNPQYICVIGKVLTSQQETDETNNMYCKPINEAEQILNFYPNPVQSKLIIEYQLLEDENVVVEITDITGRQLLAQSIQSKANFNRLTIDVSSFTQGMYFVRLKTERILEVRSFIKY